MKITKFSFVKNYNHTNEIWRNKLLKIRESNNVVIIKYSNVIYEKQCDYEFLHVKVNKKLLFVNICESRKVPLNRK